jgi:hypothetical protein
MTAHNYHTAYCDSGQIRTDTHISEPWTNKANRERDRQNTNEPSKRNPKHCQYAQHSTPQSERADRF